MNAVFGGLGHGAGDLGRFDHGLGGGASPIRTDAAHVVVLTTATLAPSCARRIADV